MYGLEIMCFVIFVCCSSHFLRVWYQSALRIFSTERLMPIKYALITLPIISAQIILYTLTTLASFDVIGSFFYILFYLLFGYTWIYFSLALVSFFFDLSWKDDILNANNKAALLAIAGAFLGTTIIYSGANVGDGPGWWCIVFAGGLGLISWFVLGRVVNSFTNIFERITIDRDINCAIRFGSYLCASGIILARASAGDWTSFAATVIEFTAGWPVVLLTILTIGVERHYLKKEKTVILEVPERHNRLLIPILWGICYIMLAIITLSLLPPLSRNYYYQIY